MCDNVNRKLKNWHTGADAAPRVALLSGVGGKAFCAGGDIVSLYHAKNNKPGYDAGMLSKFFATEYLMDYSLTTMSPLQIALWNGIVMGGGVGISCHAPIRVATELSMYAMPETGIGFFTDVGGSYFLPRIKSNPAIGLYLALTGHRLKAKELCAWGIATHYIPTEQLDGLRGDLKNVALSDTDEQIRTIVDSHSDAEATSGPITNL